MSNSGRQRFGPREVALAAIRGRDGHVTARVDRLAGQHNLSPADRALATGLAAGVVKRTATLAAVLRPLLRRPKRRLPTVVSDIIYLGLYQILFLDRIPEFAAVNETVELAHSFRQSRHTGLINGVLRSAIRVYGEPINAPPPIRPDVIPAGAEKYFAAGSAIFPDPAGDPAGYLAAAHSLPAELARRWIDQFGGLEAATGIASHANARAPLTVRPNTLKTDTDTLLDAFAQRDISAVRHANSLSIVVNDRAEALASDLLAEGHFQPQDATATAVAVAAAPRPGMRVLDVCAAPGTKTTHLAELMGDSGEITAVDVHDKLDLIEANCRRMGISIVETVSAKRLGRLDPQGFDVVLADVPCSNTGVLARRAEARWRFDAKKLSRLVGDQQFFAAAAAAFVKPGGRLVYSTCSIEPEECQQVAQHLIRQAQTIRLVSEELTMPAGADDPTAWRDGGYTAVFEG